MLHEGALEDPLWATFLARLRRRTAADYASILFRRTGASLDRAVEQGVGLVAAQPMAALYRAAPSLFHALRPGRVYDRVEWLNADDLDHDAYRRLYLGHAALAHLRLMRIREPGRSNAWLVLGRAKADFSAATGSLLGALGTHLAISLRLFEAIERQRTSVFVASVVLRRFGLGWLTVDAGGRVVDHDDHSSRALIRRTLPQDGVGGPAADAIAAFLHRSDGRPHVVRLSAQPRIDILIVRLPPEVASGSAVAAVYVDAAENHEPSTGEARSEALQALFALSRREAQLADAISRGEAIAVAAARIGITEQTARNYSKRIYAKTATSGQTDLTRLVLTGLAGLA